MNEDWKYGFKEKMENYSEPAPEGLWEEIEQSVAPERRRKPAVFYLPAAMAAAAAILLAVFFTYDRDSSTALPVSVIPQEGNTLEYADILSLTPQEMTPSGNRNVPTATEDLPPENHSVLTDNSNILTDNSNILTDNADILTDNADILTDNTDILTADGNTPDGNTGMRPANESIPFGKSDAEDWKKILLADNTRESLSRKRISLNIYAAGLPGNSEKHSGYSTSVNEISTVRQMRYGETPLADIMMFNRTKEVRTDTRHYLPVKAGVTVAWNFAPRWKLESGLYYSWLLSRSSTGSDAYYIRSRQDMHYLGIPLNLGFTIWDSKIADIYVTAGGMVEKCVGGSMQRDYYYDRDRRASDKERLQQKPWQWSAAVSAGLQFNLSRTAGIYLEPGAICHFRSRSAIENVYTEHPFNFNLNIGFRFSFR